MPQATKKQLANKPGRPLSVEELAYHVGGDPEGTMRRLSGGQANYGGAGPGRGVPSPNYIPGYNPNYGQPYQPGGPGGNDPMFPPPQWNYDYGSNPGSPQGQPMPQGSGIGSRFQDSYQQMLDAIRQGKSGQDLLASLLQNFSGSAGDLQTFMESPAFRSVMAYSGRNLPEYQKLRNLQDPTLQQMNVGLGQISATGARGVQDALGSLNATGLGRSPGAAAAITGAGQMDTAARGAAFGAGMQQQAFENQRAQYASIIDLENQMTQLALGFNPQPRQPSDKASTGDWLALAGTLVGGALGSPWLGAAVGAGTKAAQK